MMTAAAPLGRRTDSASAERMTSPSVAVTASSSARAWALAVVASGTVTAWLAGRAAGKVWFGPLPDAGRRQALQAALELPGIVDQVIGEPLGGAHSDPAAAAESIRQALLAQLKTLKGLDSDALLKRRYERLMSYGIA